MSYRRANNAKFIQDSYYMYGKHPVISALNNHRRKIDNIFCTQDIFNANYQLISRYKFQVVDNNFLTKIIGSNNNHQGIVVKLYPIFSSTIEDIDFSKPKCRVLILDQVTDPQNIGAIIRSAAAFEIEAIILPQNNSPAENAIIAKVAAGALELIKIIKVINLKAVIELLKKQGFWIVGLDSNATEILNNKIFSDRTAITIGAEDKGLRKLTKETCDHLVKIQISNKVESLNVANATAIVLHLLYATHKQ